MSFEEKINFRKKLCDDQVVYQKGLSEGLNFALAVYIEETEGNDIPAPQKIEKKRGRPAKKVTTYTAPHKEEEKIAVVSTSGD
jgi:hypothetical protein